MVTLYLRSLGQRNIKIYFLTTVTIKYGQTAHNVTKMDVNDNVNKSTITSLGFILSYPVLG